MRIYPFVFVYPFCIAGDNVVAVRVEFQATATSIMKKVQH